MRILVSAITLFMTGFLFMTTANAQEGWVIKNSNNSVSDTADNLLVSSKTHRQNSSHALTTQRAQNPLIWN